MTQTTMGPLLKVLVLPCTTSLLSMCCEQGIAQTVSQGTCRIHKTSLNFQALMLGASCAQVLMTRPREEWRQDVSGRYKVLEHFSKEDARLQFLRILRSLPYGAPTLPRATLDVPVIAAMPAVPSMASLNETPEVCTAWCWRLTSRAASSP